MQNRDKRIHFWEPESVSEGDIVWIYDSLDWIGPLFVDHHVVIGYGSNKKLVYKLFDTSTGSWYSSEKRWMRAPVEVK